MKNNIIAAVGVTALLGACGGGSTGSVTLQDLIDRGNGFADAYDTVNIDVLPPSPDSVLQPGGTANFTGIAFALRENALDEDVTDFAAIGATRVVVDIDAGEVTGTADNFFQIDNPNLDEVEDSLDSITGSSIAGTVTYALSQEVDGVNFFEGRITGSLTELNGETFDIDLPGAGGLVGPTGDAFGVEAFEENGLVAFGVFAEKDD